jgi:hypothetical protein
MKKFIVFFIILIGCLPVVSAQKGEMSLGVNAAYSTKWEQGGIGISFQYGMTNELRIVPSFNYFFEVDHTNSAAGFNVDIHRVFPVTRGLKLYPILGAGFLSYDNGDDGFGFNVGAGTEMELNERVSFFGEAKYSALISAWDQESIAVGIAVKF